MLPVPRKSKTRLLITGFGPFPGVADNRATHLVEAIQAGAVRVPIGTEVLAAVLPTDWSGVTEGVPQLLSRARADGALHFGVADSARGFRIERVARNRTHQKPDVRGCLPRGKLIRSMGPRVLRSGVSPSRVQLTLRARGLRAELSGDAGAYLCNTLYYLSLAERQQQSGTLRDALFIHIPNGAVELSTDDLLAGAATILRTFVSHLRSVRRSIAHAV